MEHSPASFEPDEYMESLLLLQEKDPVRFAMLPDAVKQVLAEYKREKEKEAARLRNQNENEPRQT